MGLSKAVEADAIPVHEEDTCEQQHPVVSAASWKTPYDPPGDEITKITVYNSKSWSIVSVYPNLRDENKYPVCYEKVKIWVRTKNNVVSFIEP